MTEVDPTDGSKISRRTLLKGGIIAGGALAGGAAIKAVADATDGDTGAVIPPALRGARARHSAPGGRPHGAAPVSARSARKPNILVIVVDQLRYPTWFSPARGGLGYAPNLQRLSRGAVNFARHYTASNDCTPARATLLTGLYTHQTGCMITGGSTLAPGFPTWGSMLRDHGYHTRWFGKWHLTHHDNHWTRASGEAALEKYGFAGGVYPSPDGGPGQGWRTDPHIAQVFADWFDHEGGAEPWCTTVSLVNPHDIAWWYVWSDRVPPEAYARPVVYRLPPNYETPELLAERRKPRLQLSFQETAAASFGPVPFSGPEAVTKWLQFLDLYMKLQRQVDMHIGYVLDTLHRRPEVAANTVVVFTSDHGEYGASHGLRGKGASGYDEAIRVPLIVKDPRAVLTAAPEQLRTQMTSSVDVAPLLLTIASGSSEWRREPHYRHLAGRADLASILADPSAPGREFVLHATDEIVTEYAIEPYAANAPLHVAVMRTAQAKYATYSNWPQQGIESLTGGRELELYDYRTQSGRLELHNSAGRSNIEGSLQEQADAAFREELREPVPYHLARAHTRGFADYFSTAKSAAAGAIARRRKRTTEELESVERLAREPSSEEEAEARAGQQQALR